MIIPFKLVVPLLFIIPLVVWFSGTRKYDFMTPRLISASELRPDFASPVELAFEDTPNAPRDRNLTDEELTIPEIDSGNLQTAPALNEYIVGAELGAASLLQLAQKLANTGQIQRAVLAYERILDSTPSGNPLVIEAEAALASLKATLPLWNVEPTAAAALEIHLTTARAPESLNESIAELTQLITLGSGNQCQPSFQIHPSEVPSHPQLSLPLVMWLTLPDEDPQTPSLAVISLIPKSDEELVSEITRGFYQLLSLRILSIAQLTPLPPLQPEEDPGKAIFNKLTRLAWQQILTTPFQPLTAGSLPIESDEPAEIEKTAE